MIDPGRTVGGNEVRASEHIDIRHATGGAGGVRVAVGIRVAGDEHHRRGVVERGRALGGDVDVEGREIFRHALPDAFDGGLLGAAESGGIRVGAVGQRGDRGAAERVVPCRAADGLTHEIDINPFRQIRAAVEFEAVGKRADRHRGVGGFRLRFPGGGFIPRFLRPVGVTEFAGVADPAGSIDVQGGRIARRKMEAA